MSSNRTTGITLLAVGLGWLVALPAFLWFMVSMEASIQAGGAHTPAGRIWQAMEILLVEPAWLAYTLSALLVAVGVVGTALLVAGIATLTGKTRGPIWAAAATVAGIVFCGICFVLHWTVLMPYVNASARPELFGAAADLEVVVLDIVGIGLISVIAAGLVFLGRWGEVWAAKRYPQT
jgi:hypothetical protein